MLLTLAVVLASSVIDEQYVARVPGGGTVEVIAVTDGVNG